MRGYRKSSAIRRVTANLPFSGVTIPPDSPEFDWPSVDEIKKVQITNKENQPKSGIKHDSGVTLVKGAAWIPDDCIDLKLRLITVAHAGNAGHRGADSTFNAIRNNFTWADIRDDIRTFVASCLLCVLAKSGNKIPRPLSTTLHATKPNEIIHFDYLFLGESENDDKYALVVKDDLSSYC